MAQPRDSHLEDASQLPVCVACASQYDDEPYGGILTNCKICDVLLVRLRL